MSFDTALLNLVGAGLATVGSRHLAVSDRLVRQSDPATLIAMLSKDGFGRQIARLAQAVARSLVGHYRSDPERLVRHVQRVTALLPDHGLAADAAAAWERAQAAQDCADDDDHQTDRACDALAAAILAGPVRTGALNQADLDADLAREILGSMLGAVLADRDGLMTVRPILERYAQDLARTGRSAALNSPRRGPPAGPAAHARLEALRSQVEAFAARGGVPPVMLSAVAAGLLAAGAHDDQVLRRLTVKITEFTDLAARLTRPMERDAAVGTLRAQAAAAMASGRLDLADRLLAQAEDVDLGANQQGVDSEVPHLLQASESRFLRGSLDELRGNYRSAASHCAAAAHCLPLGENRGRWRLAIRQAQLLARECEENGDQIALEQAVDLHQGCLQLRPRKTSSKEWAITQHLFGTLHYKLSESQGDTVHLHQAAQACRAAADELIGQREPMLWAQGLAHYATALHRIGERTGDQAALTDALAAQRETLAVFTRPASPQDWAQAQIGIAGTLLLLASNDGSQHRLAESIAAYRMALEVLDCGEAPEVAVMARIRLAEALCLAARREGHARCLVEADQVLAGIETRVDQHRAPFEWARLHAVRGTVEMELGRRSRAGDRLLRAIESLERAFEVYSAQTLPRQFAMAQRDAGAAYEALSQLERHAEPRLAQAVAAFRAAVTALDRGQAPRAWVQAELDLGRTLFLLGLETGAERMLVEALTVEQAALEALEAQGESHQAAFVRDGIAERTAHVETLRRGAQLRR